MSDASFVPGEGRTGETMTSISSVMNNVAATARVSAAFGEAQTVGEQTIIPVAEVMLGMGFGFGEGSGPEQTGMGTGGGGGGGARSRPIAVVLVDQEEVTVKPVFDFTSIALAGIATWGFIFFWLLRLIGMGRQAITIEAKAVPSPADFRKLVRRGR